MCSQVETNKYVEDTDLVHNARLSRSKYTYNIYINTNTLFCTISSFRSKICC